MKPAALLLALVAGCAWDEPHRQNVAALAGVGTSPDPAASVVLQCDQLGLRSPEAHRLCILRGIDRLSVVPKPGPSGYAPIQILPHPFPSMVPPGTVTVVPAR